jgi:biopolymer transport protein ExbD
VSAEGEIYFEGKRIDVRSVRAHIERALAEDPESGVVVVADKNSSTGVVVQAMDQCRLAGAAQVSLAARRETGE